MSSKGSARRRKEETHSSTMTMLNVTFMDTIFSCDTDFSKTTRLSVRMPSPVPLSQFGPGPPARSSPEMERPHYFHLHLGYLRSLDPHILPCPALGSADARWARWTASTTVLTISVILYPTNLPFSSECKSPSLRTDEAVLVGLIGELHVVFIKAAFFPSHRWRANLSRTMLWFGFPSAESDKLLVGNVSTSSFVCWLLPIVCQARDRAGT